MEQGNVESQFVSKNYVIRNPRIEVGTVRVRKADGIDTHRVPGKGGVLKISGLVLGHSEGLVVKEV